jgi:hypothetical protein
MDQQARTISSQVVGLQILEKHVQIDQIPGWVLPSEIERQQVAGGVIFHDRRPKLNGIHSDWRTLGDWPFQLCIVGHRRIHLAQRDLRVGQLDMVLRQRL